VFLNMNNPVMQTRFSEQTDEQLLVMTGEPELQKPSMYEVVMLNDDFTPMDFVIEVLENFFAMGREQATRIMLEVHHRGHAVCGVYSRDVAETKAMQVCQYARECEHPLQCEVQKLG